MAQPAWRAGHDQLTACSELKSNDDCSCTVYKTNTEQHVWREQDITDLHGSCIYSRLIVSNEQNANRGQQEVNLWVASMRKRKRETERECATVPQVYVLGHLKFFSCIVCITLFPSNKNSPYNRTRSKSINLLFLTVLSQFHPVVSSSASQKVDGGREFIRREYQCTARHFPQHQI